MTLLESTPLLAERVRPRRRILVVDDDPSTLSTLRNILASAGHTARCFEDVDAARDALVRESFELVLTDLYLGKDRSGYEIAEAARECRPAVPVIVLTGRPSFGAAAAGLRSSVREIVVKPVDAELLLQTCERAVEAAEIERHSRQLEAQNRVLAAVAPRIIEAKDPTTSGHAERVVRFVDRLGERCGLDVTVREKLQLAALLHDVGKIAVPRSILCKEGPLTADEREVIMRHPTVGYEILSGLEDCEDVRRWVLQHHERWDGRGYPHRLAGEDVDLPGRILILAEVYDALAEARSYKPAWPIGDIVEFFRDQAGKHFDPDLARMVADGLDREGRRFFARPDAGLFG